MEAFDLLCHSFSSSEEEGGDLSSFLEHSNLTICLGVDFEIETTIRMSTSKEESGLQKQKRRSRKTSSSEQVVTRSPLPDITTATGPYDEEEDTISRLSMVESKSFDTVSTSSLTRSSASACTLADLAVSRKVRRRDERQRRLLGLIHGVTCQHADPLRTCPALRYCPAVKRVTTHMLHCHVENCAVPSCIRSRKLWHHFLHCPENEWCSLCAVVPVETQVQLRRQFGQTFPVTSPLSSVTKTLPPTTEIMSKHTTDSEFTTELTTESKVESLQPADQVFMPSLEEETTTKIIASAPHSATTAPVTDIKANILKANSLKSTDQDVMPPLKEATKTKLTAATTVAPPAIDTKTDIKVKNLKPTEQHILRPITLQSVSSKSIQNSTLNSTKSTRSMKSTSNRSASTIRSGKMTRHGSSRIKELTARNYVASPRALSPPRNSQSYMSAPLSPTRVTPEVVLPASSLSAPLSPGSNNNYSWPSSPPLSPRRPPLSPRKQAIWKQRSNNMEI